ncbi:MAG TPA: dihydropteroate synthase [Clostridiaceae bacterium]|nr:dihydropteroate synthase [Clostridiaceae bacterium]
MGEKLNTRVLKTKNNVLQLGKKTLLMGIVNVTPDSFSDGGKYYASEKAVEHAVSLLDEGAHIIDIGGESTRPNAVLVSAEEEIARIIPVIEGVLNAVPAAIISVDTWKAKVAAAALAAGAQIVNDITGLFGSKEMAAVIAQNQAAVILMHNPLLYLPEDQITGNFPAFPAPGLPAEIAAGLRLQDLTGANTLYLETGIERALLAGVDPESIVIDPGLGFGISSSDSLELLQSLDKMTALGYPVLIGASRKRFVKNLLSAGMGGNFEESFVRTPFTEGRTSSFGAFNKEAVKDEADQNMIEDGTGAVSVYAVLKGADIIRVHDIRRQRAFVIMADALKNAAKTL